jgi:N utilization substance protein B
MAQTKERDPRQTSTARLAAVQGLYEVEITGATLDTVFLDFNEKRWRTLGIYQNLKSNNIELAEPDKNKFSQILNGVRKNLSQIDNILSSSLKNNREIEHIDALLRGMLRAGIFELFFLESVPSRVIINEYVDLARAFYSENEPSLVNGILDSVAKVVRQKN